MRSGIEPCKPAPKPFEGKSASAHIQEIEISDLQLSALRRLEMSHQINHLFVVEIKADRGPVGLRNWRFLFDRKDFIIFVEFYHTVTLRIFNPIGKDARPLGPGIGAVQRVRQSVSVENVVAKN